MFYHLISGGVQGIDGYLVRVETDISSGMPVFELTGLLGSEVRESSARVRTALKNAGYNLPIARITVNLAPADTRKQGTGYDLPIALSILTCMEILDKDSLNSTLVIGELMLSGKICPIKGILPIILKAKKEGIKRCIIPSGNEAEGSVVEGIEVIGVKDIKETIELLNNEKIIEPYDCILKEKLQEKKVYANDFKYVVGQQNARRGIEIGASGLHNVMMIGPPGAGKTMLARCIPSILPPLSEEECLEVSSIYSVRGGLKDKELITSRPFVTAHHTSTDIALIGGGACIRPGAVSMAHDGVLFLDELPEFSRRALEALRQPLEDREVNITRNRDICTFPASFMLVAAMNPCPCGYYPDRNKCSCNSVSRSKYMSKISGPLMDRIDICIPTQKVSPLEINDDSALAEDSETIRYRVERAHAIQRERFKGRNISFNSQMNNEDIDKYCHLDRLEKSFIIKLAEKYDMSARSYYRVLKIARTISDLSADDKITIEALAEAVRYKCSIE